MISSLLRSLLKGGHYNLSGGRISETGCRSSFNEMPRRCAPVHRFPRNHPRILLLRFFPGRIPVFRSPCANGVRQGRSCLPSEIGWGTSPNRFRSRKEFPKLRLPWEGGHYRPSGNLFSGTGCRSRHHGPLRPAGRFMPEGGTGYFSAGETMGMYEHLTFDICAGKHWFGFIG